MVRTPPKATGFCCPSIQTTQIPWSRIYSLLVERSFVNGLLHIARSICAEDDPLVGHNKDPHSVTVPEWDPV